MKSILFISVLAAFFFVAVVGTPLLTSVSAQSDGPAGTVADSVSDKGLADLIRRLADRSTDQLTEQRSPINDTVSIDLGEGFQNVMLARSDHNGEAAAACVTSIAEANAFFGRDLETGEAVEQPFIERAEPDLAAAHGMSRSEFEFYKRLIEEAEAKRLTSPDGASINIVNADGQGEGFNDPTAATPEGGNDGTTRGAQRLNVFNFAAGIWGAFLDTSVRIDVNSQFNPLTPCSSAGAVLGSAGPTNIYRDFPNAQYPGTWYHTALASKREGADLNGASPEINARFNSDIDTGCLGGLRFYYGLNNSTPSQRINLLVVVLHELGHGLGFGSFVDGGTGSMLNGFPDVYTRNMLDKTSGKYWHQMTNTERQASAMNNGNVVWDGPNVRIASGFLISGRDTEGRVELYTPTSFSAGSSISHFNTANSPNLLMEPSINTGIPLTLDLTRQQMRDIGWYRDTTSDRVPDTITGITPSGGTVAIGSPATVRWTNTGGFDRNVTVELSTNGGSTFSTLAASVQNTGSFTFIVPNTPTGQARIRVREEGFIEPSGVSAANFGISSGPTTVRTLFDYDGDGRADISVFRPANGSWYLNGSSAGFIAAQFGTLGDAITPADYDGDGKTDIAVTRTSPTGQLVWYVLKSSDATFSYHHFGSNGDLSAPADHDGDGRADITVFRPATGSWYRLNSGNGSVSAVNFGIAGDRPTLGDFDGDGRADIALYRPSTGVWYRINSSNGSFAAEQFGIVTDKIVAADYDGDGRTDIAVYRPATGHWYIKHSSDGTYHTFLFGLSTDITAAADYDGDGRADIAVFRPASGIWYIRNSSNATFTSMPWGQNGDRPTANAFVN